MSTKKNASERKRPGVLVHFLAGGIGGTVGASLTCPLEVVKTRLQSSMYEDPGRNLSLSFWRHPFRVMTFHVKGTLDLLKDIARNEGVRALWRGLGPTLIGVVPARAVYFAAYSHGKHFYTDLVGNGVEGPLVHVCSAVTAGICSATTTNPIWLVKTRMQLQSSQLEHFTNEASRQAAKKYRNALHCAYLVLQEEGVRGLYKGLTASFLGTAESTLQFVLYEQLKKSLIYTRRDTKEVRLAQNSASDWALTFFIAAFSKLTASILTYPHEVLRTRLRQTPAESIDASGKRVPGKPKYTGLVQATKLIWKEEGAAALYGGMSAHLLRTVPNAAIMFFCYEAVVALAEKSSTS